MNNNKGFGRSLMREIDTDPAVFFLHELASMVRAQEKNLKFSNHKLIKSGVARVIRFESSGSSNEDDTIGSAFLGVLANKKLL